MKTSKSLIQILEALQQPSKRSYPGERSKRRKAAAAAIVEAVEGLIPPEQSTREGLDKLSKSDFHIVLSMRQGYNNCRSEMLQAIKEWQ